LTGCILKQVKILHENELFLHKIFKKLSSTFYPFASPISNFWIPQWFERVFMFCLGTVPATFLYDIAACPFGVTAYFKGALKATEVNPNEMTQFLKCAVYLYFIFYALNTSSVS